MRLRIGEDMSLEDILHSRTDPVHQDIQQLRGRVVAGIFMEWSQGVPACQLECYADKIRAILPKIGWLLLLDLVCV